LARATRRRWPAGAGIKLNSPVICCLPWMTIPDASRRDASPASCADAPLLDHDNTPALVEHVLNSIALTAELSPAGEPRWARLQKQNGRLSVRFSSMVWWGYGGGLMPFPSAAVLSVW
jgi:hypothetical protein